MTHTQEPSPSRLEYGGWEKTIKELENCLAYCLEQNGRDHCKNCGLDNEMITRLKENIYKLLNSGRKMYEQGKKDERLAWLNGERCHICGKDVKSDGLSETCADCFGTR